MKKYRVLTLVILSVLMAGAAGTAKAQSPVNFGLKGGINLANFTNTEADTEVRSGFTGGISMDISLPGAPLGIETGAYYSQMGAEISDNGLEGSYNLDYIQVPLLAKINFGLPGPATPHLLVGPYMGFNINAEAELSEGGTSVSSDISDQVNDTDFGGIAGLGIDFNVGLTKLSAQARYGFGLTGVFDGELSADDEDVRNSAVSLVLGIQF